MTPTVRMLGTRGVPAAHGGFETAVENIGLDLVDRAPPLKSLFTRES